MTSPTLLSLRASTAVRAWALPVALGTAGAVEAALTPGISDGSGLPAVFVSAMALCLVWRFERPLAALAGTLGVFSVQEVWGSGTLSEAVAPFVLLLVAMYSAASRLSGGSLGAAVVGSCLTIGGTIVLDAGRLDADSLTYSFVVIAAAFVTGRVVGQRTREAGRLADEKSLLVEERESLEREAVARERMRIAHELHDLITHRVSAMVLQASTERRILGLGTASAAPDLATLTATLESIETMGREAMSELRQLLGALFHDGEELRRPQPGIGDLKALVEQSSRAGVDVSLEVRGRQRALPEPLEVSIYRLAQEAMSNAMRHASGSTVRLVIEHRREAVGLTVTNSPGLRAEAQDPGLGLGVPGMRERVRHFGGSLVTGPTTEGGFAVQADFPLPDEPLRDAST